MDSQINSLAEVITKAQNIVVFTGAGISTESGISDYRSKGGIWERFKPITYQEFIADNEKRKEYWKRKFELMQSMENAKPNEGHLAIRALDQLGKLKGIITQNIDGLHHMAGHNSEKILEIHGSNRETVCLSCNNIRPWQDVYQRLKDGEEFPLCSQCGGLLKPNTISFGQSLNPDVLNQSLDWIENCEILLVAGSTLIVEPAASFPRIAKERGASLVIVTLSETPLDGIADTRIFGEVGAVLSTTVMRVKEDLKRNKR